MSRLDDLYKAIETMRREHLSTSDLEAKVSLAEEERNNFSTKCQNN